MQTCTVVKAIAINTFYETVRDKVLYAIVLFAFLAVLAGLLFGSLSVEQDVRILEDLGLATITIFGGLIAIFVGTNLVFKEIDKKTILLIFSKPIQRWQFITGKFCGLALCIFVVLVTMGMFLLGVAGCQTGNFVSGPHLFFALALLYVELLFVIALATFFSTFATPLMSMLYTLGLWICCHLSQSLLKLGSLSSNVFTQQLSQSIYNMLPDLACLTYIRSEILGGKMAPYNVILCVIAYIFAYIVLLLSFATVVAEQREFQ